MTSTQFTYGEIDSPLLTRAVQALIKHHNDNHSSSTNLLGNDTNINLEFSLLRVPGNPSPKPIRLSIPHPLHKVNYTDKNNNEEEDDHLETPDVCIIVKDSSKPWVQEMIENHPQYLGCIKKVLTLDSLRKKFGRYDQKRELVSKFDIFLADDRILPMLGKALGKKFFDTKKQPIPIKLTRKEALPFAVHKSLKATFMYIPSGRCLSIKAGNTSIPIDFLVDNCKSIVKEAAMKIPNKWKNITKISIKTSRSVSLPFYNITPEELLEAKEIVEEDIETTKTTDDNDDSVKKQNKKRSRTNQKEEEDTKTNKEIELEKKRAKLEKKKREKKSPLLQALKKQKEMTENDEETMESSKKQIVEETKKTSQKENEMNDEKTEMLKKEKKRKKEKKKESKKKEDDQKDADAIDTPEETKKEFIKSKKFSGAMKGYVFKKSNAGVGYYLDVKPVVDKSLLASLKGTRGRSSISGGNMGKRGRSKSSGRKGRKSR